MKLIAIAIAVLVAVALGFFFAAGPEPHIEIPPAVLWTVGPLEITDTLMGAWLSMIMIIVVAWWATRSLSLIPSGVQNFIEGFIDFLLTQVEEIAGREHGRKMFVFAATIFIFILVANWSSLLPFYKSIGITQDYGQEIFHEIEHYAEEGEPISEDHHFAAWETNNTGGVGIVPNGAYTFTFDTHAGEDPGLALDRYIVALAEQYTDFDAELAEGEDPSATNVEDAAAALEADPDAPTLLAPEGEDAHGVESPALGTEIGGIDFPGAKLTVVYPFFRPAFSDLNNTLALAICAFFAFWIWGFQAQGVGYLNKFFIAPWKSPIMTFVGFLELLSEFIRVISFSVRLFGNIFAGSVLLLIMTFLVPFIAPIAIYGLGAVRRCNPGCRLCCARPRLRSWCP
ncbi:MAG: FoF1 ATP synthase subunit a [Dehalococcoidia bacterium]|nr:FoF1 ATP synthase subunit a [Dehalococcoidia bacterium]